MADAIVSYFPDQQSAQRVVKSLQEAGFNASWEDAGQFRHQGRRVLVAVDVQGRVDEALTLLRISRATPPSRPPVSR